jgi:hypothetical protein
VLLVGWGSTQGRFAAVDRARGGRQRSAIHIKHINPLPPIGEYFRRLQPRLRREMNDGLLRHGQLDRRARDYCDENSWLTDGLLTFKVREI